MYLKHYYWRQEALKWMVSSCFARLVSFSLNKGKSNPIVSVVYQSIDAIFFPSQIYCFIMKEICVLASKSKKRNYSHSKQVSFSCKNKIWTIMVSLRQAENKWKLFYVQVLCGKETCSLLTSLQVLSVTSLNI